jgi:hypothetical protein
VLGAAWVDPDWGSLLWVMMVSGMRLGEISALRWRHVDFALSHVPAYCVQSRTQSSATRTVTTSAYSGRSTLAALP